MATCDTNGQGTLYTNGDNLPTGAVFTHSTNMAHGENVIWVGKAWANPASKNIIVDDIVIFEAILDAVTVAEYYDFMINGP